MVRLIKARERNKELLKFLQQLKATGASYDCVVENGNITKIYVRIPDNGDWGKVRYGRIIGSEVVSYIQTIYLPRMVDGKFIYNYNDSTKGTD